MVALEACEYLLRQNCDVNSTLNDFSTPLMLAVEEVLTGFSWDFHGLYHGIYADDLDLMFVSCILYPVSYSWYINLILFLLTYEHLWTSVNICEHLWTPMNTYEAYCISYCGDGRGEKHAFDAGPLGCRQIAAGQRRSALVQGAKRDGFEQKST